MLETERMTLRRWDESDAPSLYVYARDPDVGPITGWPPHRSLQESREVIRNVFCAKEAYAICLKGEGQPIGAIELMLKGHTDLADDDDACELGYWLGKPFWGRGLMSEAVREMLRYAFEDLGMTTVWCGYYAGNERSKRVQQKAGFRFRRKTEGVDVPLMHEKRTEFVSSLTKDQWIWDRIRTVDREKKRYLPLLLLADEQEDMIDRYIDRGTLYVAEDDGRAAAEVIVTDEGDGIAEIKSLAVAQEKQRKGYGRSLIRFVEEKYKTTHRALQVGTGDSPITVPFYERCGFVRHHVVESFFLNNYDHPIFEGGRQLRDMVYLRKPLR